MRWISSRPTMYASACPGSAMYRSVSESISTCGIAVLASM
jgi:hypothetical protein